MAAEKESIGPFPIGMHLLIEITKKLPPILKYFASFYMTLYMKLAKYSNI